jgi:hypothetical protein
MTARLQSLHCTSFGVSFQLAAESDCVLASMFACAPLGTQVCAPSSPAIRQFTLLSPRGTVGFRLAVDDKTIAEDGALQPALDRFARDLMVHVANYAPDRVFLHAGVVGWQDRALLLPGTGFAGKTTLVAELVRAGAIYYSDEYAVLDQHGRVYPYPRDLQMRLAGSPQQSAVAVEHLTGTVGTSPLSVSRVVFTEYRESGHWSPEPVSAGMAVLEMLRHTIPVQRTPARVMATLAKMMETATAVRSERGEASEAANSLLTAIPLGGAPV